MQDEGSKFRGSPDENPEGFVEDREFLILDAADTAANEYLKFLFRKYGRRIPPMAIVEEAGGVIIAPKFRDMYLDQEEIRKISSPILTQWQIRTQAEQNLFMARFFQTVSLGYPKTVN